MSNRSSFSPTTTMTHIHASFLDEDPLYYHPTTRTFRHATFSSSSSTAASSFDDESCYEYDLDSDDGETHVANGECFAAISDHGIDHEDLDDRAAAASHSKNHADLQETSTSYRRLPEYFRCPISRDCMRDPVIDTDGHSYERRNIVYWLAWHETSPLTRRPMTKAELRPNRALRCAIDAWRATASPPSSPAKEQRGTTTRKVAEKTADKSVAQTVRRRTESSSPARATVQLTNMPLLEGQQGMKEARHESAYA